VAIRFETACLRHAQLVGRVLQLSELGGADERSHRFGVHRPILCMPNRSLWLAGKTVA